MNHHFFVYGDAKQAFDEKGGRFDEGAASDPLGLATRALKKPGSDPGFLQRHSM